MFLTKSDSSQFINRTMSLDFIQDLSRISIPSESAMFSITIIADQLNIFLLLKLNYFFIDDFGNTHLQVV